MRSRSTIETTKPSSPSTFHDRAVNRSRPSTRARHVFAASLVGLASLAIGGREALACGSCRGPGGAGSALTAPWQRWGVSAAQTMRIGHGVTDQNSTFRAFRKDSHDRVLELALAAAVRPIDAIELGATAAYGNVMVGGPGFRSSRGALGDLALRVRWEVLGEPPIELSGQQRLPAVGLTLTTRLPTGPVDRVSDAGSAGPSPGTVGSTATSQGLGTFEGAFALDVRKSFASKYQIGAVGELGLRAPDEALGLDRALGPRGLVRLMAMTFVGDMTFGFFADVAAEGNVSYGGRTAPDSNQRTTAFGLSASLKTDVGIRTGLAVSVQPPIDGFSTNAVPSTGLSTFLAFTK